MKVVFLQFVTFEHLILSKKRQKFRQILPLTNNSPKKPEEATTSSFSLLPPGDSFLSSQSMCSWSSVFLISYLFMMKSSKHSDWFRFTDVTVQPYGGSWLPKYNGDKYDTWPDDLDTETQITSSLCQTSAVKTLFGQKSGHISRRRPGRHVTLIL